MALDLTFWTATSITLGAAILFPFIMGLFRKNQFEVDGKTVLLTGASEGMGRSVATILSQKGANIIIAARNVSKLEEALRHIKAAAANPSTQRFHYISGDVSEESGTARIVSEAIAWNNGVAPDIVWCVAGAAFPSLFLSTPAGSARTQMNVNYWSCYDMAQAILREWLSPSAASTGKRRHLVFTSTVAAFYPVAGYSPYAPSKAAIKSLSDTLAQEVLLYGNDVRIHTVFPGTILSPGFEIENKTKPEITRILEASDPVQTPEVVAAKAIKGLEKGEYLVTVGFLGSAMRGCAWGGSERNNWVGDTLMTWVTSIAWAFIGKDLDGKVKTFRKQNGHPSTYAKTT